MIGFATTGFSVWVTVEPRKLLVGVRIKKPWWEMGQRWHQVRVMPLPAVMVQVSWRSSVRARSETP